MKAVREVPMLELESVVHRYGDLVALDNVSLTAGRGEFLTILGASGSGKTTLLRVISGLERPYSAKRMVIGEQDVAGVPPAKRNCTTVFQNYALFPHMSVGENVAYGLRVRRVPEDTARREMLNALETVQLGGMENRRVSELSGGQKQRVAIARSVVTKPAIMLLDEPLGALDERLRVDMQEELVDIQRRLGMTFIYITHSQEEALSMSDRVVLMRRGKIEQQGVPSDLFDRPKSPFAATFMGFENLISGQVVAVRGDRVEVGLPASGTIIGIWTGEGVPEPGAPVQVAVRAERLMSASKSQVSVSSGLNVLPCRPLDQRYRGKYSDRSVETGVGTLKMRSWDRVRPADDFDAVSWHPDDCVVLAAMA